MEQANVSPPQDKPKRKQARWLNQTGKPNGKGLDAPWEDIKNAIGAGISFSKVAKQFAHCHPQGWQAFVEVIKKRAQRQGWFVPVVALAQQREKLEEKGYDVPKMAGTDVSPLRDREKTGTLVAQSLEEMGQEGSLIAGELVLNQLRAAQAAPERIAPLVDVKDITSAAKLVRLVAGMDKQGPAVSLSLWGGPMSPPGTSRDNVRDVSGSVLDEWEA
jgi:hypothetical protein